MPGNSDLSTLSLAELIRRRDVLRVHCGDQLSAAQRDGRTYMTPVEARGLAQLEVVSARISALTDGGRDV